MAVVAMFTSRGTTSWPDRRRRRPASSDRTTGTGSVGTGRTVGRRRRNCSRTTVGTATRRNTPGRRSCRCTARPRERRTGRCTTSKRSGKTSKTRPGTVGPRTGRPSTTGPGKKSQRRPRLTGTSTRSGTGRRPRGNPIPGSTAVGTVRSCTAAGTVGRRLKRKKKKKSKDNNLSIATQVWFVPMNTDCVVRFLMQFSVLCDRYAN